MNRNLRRSTLRPIRTLARTESIEGLNSRSTVCCQTTLCGAPHPLWPPVDRQHRGPNGQHRPRFGQHPRQHRLGTVVPGPRWGECVASGAAVANQGRGKYPVVDALNRDWSVLADRHRGLVARWALRDEAFIDCVSLDDVLFAVQLRPDAVLRALLTEVSKGDELAGRVVLQAMIGRMVRMAIRDPKAGIDEYISALWCQIQNYPLASRPNRDCGESLDGHLQVPASRTALATSLRDPAVAAADVCG